jgi:hypothetical protein
MIKFLKLFKLYERKNNEREEPEKLKKLKLSNNLLSKRTSFFLIYKAMKKLKTTVLLFIRKS